MPDKHAYVSCGSRAHIERWGVSGVALSLHIYLLGIFHIFRNPKVLRKYQWSVWGVPHVPGEFEALRELLRIPEQAQMWELKKNSHEAWSLWSLTCLALRRWNKTLIWPKEARSELVFISAFREPSPSQKHLPMSLSFCLLCSIFFSAAKSHVWKSGIDTKRNHSRDEVQYRGQNPLHLRDGIRPGRPCCAHVYREPWEWCIMGFPSTIL